MDSLSVTIGAEVQKLEDERNKYAAYLAQQQATFSSSESSSSDEDSDAPKKAAALATPIAPHIKTNTNHSEM